MDKIISFVPDGRDYISVAEAEAIFGICKETMRRLILSRKAQSINIGKRLTGEEKKQAEEYEDFETFLSTLEEKYGFILSNCQWMTCETLQVYHYEDGKEV